MYSYLAFLHYRLFCERYECCVFVSLYSGSDSEVAVPERFDTVIPVIPADNYIRGYRHDRIYPDPVMKKNLLSNHLSGITFDG